MPIDLTVNDNPSVPLNVESGNGTDFSHSEEYILAVSPSASVTQTENGAVITIRDKNGETSAILSNGKDGVDGEQGPKGDTGRTPNITASKSYNVTTLYTDGKILTYIYDGENGRDGKDGQDGATGPAGSDGKDGKDGKDGHNPVVTASKENGITTIKADGISIAYIVDGQDGRDGIDGSQGPAGPQGERGEQGPKGDTGATGATGPQGPKGDKGDTGATGPAGSDATVTAANIEAALGYVPANPSSIPTVTNDFTDAYKGKVDALWTDYQSALVAMGIGGD